MTRTILLADDSVTIQKVVELTFLDEDFRVVTVGDGADHLRVRPGHDVEPGDLMAVLGQQGSEIAPQPARRSGQQHAHGRFSSHSARA